MKTKLNVVISKAEDGDQDYIQIMPVGKTPVYVGVLLIADQIVVTDKRKITAKPRRKK